VDEKTLFDKIENDIQECANSIDLYYKESRVGMLSRRLADFANHLHLLHSLVKFFKATEWKDLMMEYANKFFGHRSELVLKLQINVADAVESLHSKMDAILRGLFKPQYNWETTLAERIQQQESSSDLMTKLNTNTEVLTEFLHITIEKDIDPAFSNLRPKTAESREDEDQTINEAVESIKKDLQSSLADRRGSNRKFFDVKFTLQTKRIEEEINQSAEGVIRALSGPYDRLYHEVKLCYTRDL